MGVDPYNILAVTFTNKASNEMRERVNLLLGDRVDVWVRTFHSSAAKLLRMWGTSLGIDPGFSIVDQQDQRSLLKKIIRNMDRKVVIIFLSVAVLQTISWYFTSRKFFRINFYPL